jgi:hypothetical protein
MSRRAALAIIGAVLAVAALLVLLARRDRPAASVDTATPAVSRERGGERTITLYFPGDAGLLEAEEREIAADLEGTALAGRILVELLSGPASDGLHPPLEENTTVDFVERAGADTLYVSLAPPEGATAPRYGSRAEILAAYSIVHSLCANVPDDEGVVFLWRGVAPTTFAGNLDTRRPLTPDPRWIRSPA